MHVTWQGQCKFLESAPKIRHWVWPHRSHFQGTTGDLHVPLLNSLPFPIARAGKAVLHTNMHTTAPRGEVGKTWQVQRHLATKSWAIADQILVIPAVMFGLSQRQVWWWAAGDGSRPVFSPNISWFWHFWGDHHWSWFFVWQILKVVSFLGVCSRWL